MAGNCDDSFISKNMYPVRSPLSSAKYAASGLRSSRMFLIVVPRLPARAAALPASTGIETLSIMRILRYLLKTGSIIRPYSALRACFGRGRYKSPPEARGTAQPGSGGSRGRGAVQAVAMPSATKLDCPFLALAWSHRGLELQVVVGDLGTRARAEPRARELELDSFISRSC